MSFRECVDTSERFCLSLTELGLTSGDAIVSTLPAGVDLAALMLASWERRFRLLLVSPAQLERLSGRLLSSFQLLVTEDAGVSDPRIRCVAARDLHSTLGRPGSGPEGKADARAELVVLDDGIPKAIDTAVLARSVDNFTSLYTVAPGDVLVSGSTPFTLEGAFASVVLPLALGLTVHQVAASPCGDRPIDPAAWLAVGDLCELPGPAWAALAQGAVRSPPPRLRTLICGSGRLDASTAVRVERGFGRPIARGFGTVETGLWAVPIGRSAAQPGRFTAEIRPLRSPLQLLDDDGAAGEVVLCDTRADAGVHRTGAVGWRDGAGRLEIAGHLSDVAVREGHAFLLSDHDQLLQRRGVGESRTFRENGGSPTDRTICVVQVESDVGGGSPAPAGAIASATVRHGFGAHGTMADVIRMPPSGQVGAGPAAVREATGSGSAPTEPAPTEHGGTAWSTSRTTILDDAARALAGTIKVIDRIVTVSGHETLPELDALRLVASGKAGPAVVTALTARRFRRNSAYDEAGLAAAVDRALLGNGRLDFLMFWGCGPRRHAAGPDRAAVDALGELLAAAEAAAPLRAQARIICTDLHATNNGHSELHYRTYFSEIAALTDRLDVVFEMESAVWARGGLSKARVSALEETPGFAARWAGFALRERFVHQAERHSRMADKTAAARHYYATCLLEREVLKSMFAESVFLTYNGPDFNECFPDLPTLYVYPGPRGPNDKPWFVDVPAAASTERDRAQVAAA